MFNNNSNNVGINVQSGGAINVYGISLKSRAISLIGADQDSNRFLVGTQALKEENEVRLIEEKENEGIGLVSIFSHPKEIWSITSCTYDADSFFTVYNTGTEYRSSCWKMNHESTTLEELFELKGHQGMIKPILCDPSETDDYVISLDDSTIRLWSIKNNTPSVVKSFGGLNKLTAGSINPNINNQLATANDVNIKGWDFRSGKDHIEINNNDNNNNNNKKTYRESFKIDKAHSELIRDIDFNPNKPYILLSAGDDGKLKFWDTRYTEEPVKMFSGHNHWIWNAKFNKYHDQLVITSSSDNTVNLWHVYSISSAMQDQNKDITSNSSPSIEGQTNEQQQQQQQQQQQSHSSHSSHISSTGGKTNKRKEDKLIKTFEEHEDSVYNVCWGTSNFIFASLSYDGRVVINNVPKEYADLLTIE
ncbi:WD40 repeat-containing protein [Heterostelium album PN500]|uniref:WD40 repeat-containing protein n=1 Tax=Heterostelium pallidum (strain ATCC 26659 / Pp 5 / PN500) TaxID=670386 RepID=D3BEI2_HETP5|nr:WD40 repeat-containing protein [Heterostelium album PN500]EFA80313.1 WD40 repeat-containing protein [Heterostelium album PN500]|eukprot:XP_020432433.1 WD40 repeat-containing protein [Heterostelium album PN500]